MEHAEIVIIGAGWSGLTAASCLAAAGREVVVVEKSRGPGGRSATRREGDWRFDHGAQYFTARDPGFAEQARQWQADGLVAGWHPRLKQFGPRPAISGQSPDVRLVARPGMNAVLHALSLQLDCRWGWRAESLSWQSGWTIRADDGRKLSADALVITAPPEQSAALLGAEDSMTAALSEVNMAPCWALMLGYDKPLSLAFDAAFVNQGPLSWIARNGSKPGRSGESWVVHAGPEYSSRQLEQPAEQVAAELLDAFVGLTGTEQIRPAFSRLHRWRYALASDPLEVGCLHDAGRRLVLAGDWCAGNRIEGAWLSGRAAADRLLARGVDQTS